MHFKTGACVTYRYVPCNHATYTTRTTILHLGPAIHLQIHPVLRCIFNYHLPRGRVSCWDRRRMEKASLSLARPFLSLARASLSLIKAFHLRCIGEFGIPVHADKTRD